MKYALIGLAALTVVGLLTVAWRKTPEGVVLFTIAAGGGAILWYSSYQRKEAHKRHLDRLRQEGKEWAVQADQHGLTAIGTRLILKDNEDAVLEELSALQETRAYRVYGGVGTRVVRVYVGGGSSESHQRWRVIDQGTLTLTTKRLIFDGSHENRTIRLSDILSVNTFADAIEVSTQTRAKSQAYHVRNPLIWTTAIQEVAAGNFKIRTPD